MNLARKSWIGGDACAMSRVELMVHFGIHSTFVVKTNVRFMPTKVLLVIEKTRYGERTAGHWVPTVPTLECALKYMSAH